MRGCTQRVCSAQAVCSLAGPRSIKSVPGRFQVKRHSRDVAYQAFPLSACNIERWVWPGDEARPHIQHISNCHQVIFITPYKAMCYGATTVLALYIVTWNQVILSHHMCYYTTCTVLYIALESGDFINRYMYSTYV